MAVTDLSSNEVRIYVASTGKWYVGNPATGRYSEVKVTETPLASLAWQPVGLKGNS